jgi:uncharacterized damage-inducible protein DinB
VPEEIPNLRPGESMSTGQRLIKQLEAARKLFGTTTSVFDSANAGFAPEPDLYTVAGHIAHAADSIDWFIEGAFGAGWDMNFEALIARARAVTTLEEATAWLDNAFANAVQVVSQASEGELMEPMPDGPILGGVPRMAVINEIVDHTAHHRGSLAVYARLVGKAPPMLYS